CFVVFFAPLRPHVYTLSLHDALPISARWRRASRSRRPPPVRASSTTSNRRPRPPREEHRHACGGRDEVRARQRRRPVRESRRRADRKSTRLNSSHDQISYAVFCLKKK